MTFHKLVRWQLKLLLDQKSTKTIELVVVCFIISGVAAGSSVAGRIGIFVTKVWRLLGNKNIHLGDILMIIILKIT